MAVPPYPDDYDAEYLQRIRKVVFDLLNEDAGDDVRISPNTLALYTTNLPTGVSDLDLGQYATDLQTSRPTVDSYNAIDNGITIGTAIEAHEGVGGLGPLGGDIAIGSNIAFYGAVIDGAGVNVANALYGTNIDLGATSRNSVVALGGNIDASSVTSMDGATLIATNPILAATDLDGVIGIGDTPTLRAKNGIAIGPGTVVDTGHTNSVAIGFGATTTAANQAAFSGSLYIPYLQMQTGLTPSWTEGLMYYSSADGTFVIYNDESEIALQIGQENYIRVRNNTGSTITNGSVVYVSGASGGLPQISLARADAQATATVMGIATHDIEDSTIGYVTSFGQLRDIDTSSFSPGTALYLSPTTAGAITSTKPSFPDLPILLGYVTAQDASNGRIYISVSPEASAGGGGGISGSINTNQIAYGAAVDAIAGSNNFTYDGTDLSLTSGSINITPALNGNSPPDSALNINLGNQTTTNSQASGILVYGTLTLNDETTEIFATKMVFGTSVDDYGRDLNFLRCNIDTSAIGGGAAAHDSFFVRQGGQIAQSEVQSAAASLTESRHMHSIKSNGADIFNAADIVDATLATDFRFVNGTTTNYGGGLAFASNATASHRAGIFWWRTGGTGSDGAIGLAAGNSSGDLVNLGLVVDGATDLVRMPAAFDVRIQATTASTSPTTGALVISGGLGLASDLSIGGEIDFGSNDVIIRSSSNEINIAGPNSVRTNCIAIGATICDSADGIAIGFGSRIKASNRTSNSTVVGTGSGATTNTGANLGAMTIFGDGTTASESGTGNPLAFGQGSQVDADNAGVIGNSITNSVANRIQIGSSTQHVYTPDGFVQDSTAYHYYGDPSTDGSWRIGRSGNDLIFDRRESGSWVTKQTITP